MGEWMLLLYNSGVEGCRCNEWTFMVRFAGRRRGGLEDLGDRNGEGGAEVEMLFLAVGTLRLRFLVFRGRFGGDGDLWELLGKPSSGIVAGQVVSQSPKAGRSRNRGA